MARLRIPQNWSAEQALAVLDLLDTCYDAVWSAYEERVTELILRDEQHRATAEHQRQSHLVPPNGDDDPDVEIPF
jgi:hypothetical protein